MKAYEILSEVKKQELPKPRNFVAKNATTSGAGAHKDKKKAEKQGDFKHKKQAIPADEGLEDPKDNPCWKGYKPVGTKKKGGRTVPNCVPKESVESLEEYGDTAKGQKMLTKVQKRAVDRMIKADDRRDAKDAKKNQDTANRAWDRMDDKDLEEMYKRRSSYYNPMDYERDEQNYMDMSRREFKRRELEHELGHEDTPEFKAMMRDRDRGPWYLRINGKILKSQGEPKVFDWKKGANNYALAIIKNKPELQGKIMLTKRPEDEVVAETATAGATSAGNVAVGAVYKNKPPKQPKNKDGTAKNALDMKANLLTGGSIKR